MLSTGQCDHQMEDEGLYGKDIQSTRAMAGEPLHDCSQLLDRTMVAGLLEEVIGPATHNGPGTTLPSGISTAARLSLQRLEYHQWARSAPGAVQATDHTSHFCLEINLPCY